MTDLETRLAAAVRQFWKTRDKQAKKQGKQTGRKDQGFRTAVTGGAQMDGFIKLVSELLLESGLSDATIFCKKKVELPGFFRPTKEWDLLVVAEGQLVASIEFKSHIGPSFGNNYNNRTEEAIGNATDLWTAYREGAFQHSTRPWLGYLMLLEETPASIRSVRAAEPHFRVLQEFRDASYAKRYELLCVKLVRERLYDAACLLLSAHSTGSKGHYKEPNPEVSFRNFANSLTARAIAFSSSSSSSSRRTSLVPS